MGKGTIALNKIPLKRKLYGDEDFHLRPIYQTDDKYYFALRPSQTEGYLFEIEGEFNMGQQGLDFEKTEVRKGIYKNTRYVYYDFDLERMNKEQKKKILRWAKDGKL